MLNGIGVSACAKKRLASTLDDARMMTGMKITELKREMDAQFAAVRERFAEVDARFGQVDARFEQVDARFDWLEQRMVAEHETTRRYMDIVAEQFGEYVKMLADGIGLNTERLDRHEKRITALEERR
jgi:hypothetical protein